MSYYLSTSQAQALEDYIDVDRDVFATEAKYLYPKAVEEIVTPPSAVRFAEHLPSIDHITGGFREKEFTILCGPTGTGKSTLLVNIGVAIAQTKEPQFVASVENGPEDYLKRMLSALGDVDLTTGDQIPLDTIMRIDQNHRQKLIDGNLFLSLYEDRGRIEHLMSDIAWHVKHKGVRVAWIDNLNFFMDVTSDANAVVEMDRVIHSLIIFCKKVGVHIVMVMHPRKTNDGRVDSEFDIKGSSTAVQEAQNILLWNRAHPALVEAGLATHNDRELKIAKMRRRGMSVHSVVIVGTNNGVRYFEKDMISGQKYFQTIRDYKPGKR